MLINKEIKLKREDELFQGSAVLTTAFVWRLQDIIEDEFLSYTEEDIKNNNFLLFVSDYWPEEHDSEVNGLTYYCYFEKDGKTLYDVLLKLTENEVGYIVSEVQLIARN